MPDPGSFWGDAESKKQPAFQIVYTALEPVLSCDRFSVPTLLLPDAAVAPLYIS